MGSCLPLTALLARPFVTLAMQLFGDVGPFQLFLLALVGLD